MPKGAFAVFVAAFEDWMFPIDEAARAVGARVVREPLGEVVAAQMKSEDQAGRAELARLQTEIAHALGDAKAKLELERDRAKARHAENRAKIQKTWLEIRKTNNAKIASAKEKADHASGDAKRRHEAIAQKLARFADEYTAASDAMLSNVGKECIP